MANFVSIPFKAESGMMKTDGIAKFSSAGIVMEFETKILGLIGRGVKEVRIPIAELMSVNFKSGFLKRSAKIELRLRNFAMLSELPNEDGKVTMKINHENFEPARDAVERMQKDLARHEAELPPPQTGVSDLFRDDDGEDETKILN